MTPQQKQRYFDLLIDIGFKEIEVGFPAASQDDFDFVRNLIENGHIPDDVTISVLTQCRPHLIERTFEAIAGIKNCIFHIYIATSELHRWFVFGLDDQQVIDTAVTSIRQIRDGVRAMNDSKVMLEFSPEEFTDTTLEYSLAVCDAVVDEWDPDPGEKVILNLPQTVERRLPNQYADMIEAPDYLKQVLWQGLVSGLLIPGVVRRDGASRGPQPKLYDVKTIGFQEGYYGLPQRNAGVAAREQAVVADMDRRSMRVDSLYNDCSRDEIEPTRAKVREVGITDIAVGALGEVGPNLLEFCSLLAEKGSDVPERFGCWHGQSLRRRA